ncbi:hypothetical protein [Thioalkalivibrio sp. HK1]|uniref:hypothetical protein n=1 Tax=Thioalkalivibrio sp. HK1 TaxID=1469245 RepID=UPI0012DFE14F|nr:hypothetical protein [Thioalkalivibrio sp. HK1]
MKKPRGIDWKILDITEDKGIEGASDASFEIRYPILTHSRICRRTCRIPNFEVDETARSA